MTRYRVEVCKDSINLRGQVTESLLSNSLSLSLSSFINPLTQLRLLHSLSLSLSLNFLAHSFHSLLFLFHSLLSNTTLYKFYYHPLPSIPFTSSSSLSSSVNGFHGSQQNRIEPQTPSITASKERPNQDQDNQEHLQIRDGVCVFFNFRRIWTEERRRRRRSSSQLFFSFHTADSERLQFRFLIWIQ